MAQSSGAELDLAERTRLLLLTILALLGQRSLRTPLARMMARAGARIPRAKRRGSQGGGDEAPTATNLLPVLRQWEKHGWVVESGDEWMLVAERAHHVLSLAANANDELLMAAEAAVSNELRYQWTDRHIVGARAALYRGDMPAFEEHLQEINHNERAPKSAPLPFFSVFSPLDASVLIDRLPPALQESCLEQAFEFAIIVGFSLPTTLADRVATLTGPKASSVRASAFILYDLLGSDVGLGSAVEGAADGPSFEALAMRALIRGEFDDAKTFIERAWGASTGGKKSKKPRLQTPVAPLLTLAAFTGSPELKAIAAAQPSSPGVRGLEPHVYSPVKWLLGSQRDIHRLQCDFESWSSVLMASLAIAWAVQGQDTHGLPKEWNEMLRRSVKSLERQGFDWVAAQFNACADHFARKTPAAEPKPLTALHAYREPWETRLDAIEAELAAAATTQPASQSEERLAWFVKVGPAAIHTFEDEVMAELGLVDDDGRLRADQEGITSHVRPYRSWVSIEARLQKRRKNGWTSGRTVALRRLAEQSSNLSCMTPHDRRIAATIVMRQSYYERFYEFTKDAPLALVGHPAVYWKAGDDRPVEVVRGQTSLVVNRLDNDRIRLTVHPHAPTDDVWCQQTDPHQLTVYSLDDVQQRLAERIGAGLEIPAKGQSRVQGLLAQAAEVLPVHSDLATDSEDAVACEANPQPVVELDRYGQGLRARFLVYPLGLNGPRLHPGQGRTALVASIDGQVMRCERDLETEGHRLEAIFERCPTLDRGEREEQVDLPDVLEALEALEELQAVADDVQLLWKKGTPLTVTEERGESALRIALQTEASEWFSATSELRVDDDLVLGLRALLDLLPQQRGRYVPLEDDKFLALSESLTAKLHTLAAVGIAGDAKSQAVSLHPVAAGLVAGWSGQVDALDLDEACQSRLRRAQEAVTLEPDVPKTFEADLRPYQHEGFRWMARLAHWGAGACLADDMGLGKTVQALAMLVHRAELGPALVVAPTSVCSGWLEQAARFAPTLNAYVVTGPPDGADPWKPYDVAIISYTMMALHIDALDDISLATVVLDEAQAIKNATTQRAQAARRLQGAFRLATTGTPVENHLGELWSLMSFLNPGLLGTAKAFDKRFGRAHRSDERERLTQLKSLMHPFILRRKKRDVLKELPPRTEIIVKVEPSEEERAFFEALRRRALERLADSGDELKKSAMTILAELTRLRQAACHPALVDPNIGIDSSKLGQLIKIATELTEGGHRMLVFSQFVKFLKHVRARFDEAGLSYQYLDGTTPRADRDRAVRAFQAGEGDAFIISLKAGGTGLNLTGADYVIHLDPWWNPAVDDQASSRAHRIGQKRPVTVYKLVTQGSVEEKVYALHAEKRDLAERLFAGTDIAQTPDVEALYALLARPK